MVVLASVISLQSEWVPHFMPTRTRHEHSIILVHSLILPFKSDIHMKNHIHASFGHHHLERNTTNKVLSTSSHEVDNSLWPCAKINWPSWQVYSGHHPNIASYKNRISPYIACIVQILEWNYQTGCSKLYTVHCLAYMVRDRFYSSLWNCLSLQ